MTSDTIRYDTLVQSQHTGPIQQYQYNTNSQYTIHNTVADFRQKNQYTCLQDVDITSGNDFYFEREVGWTIRYKFGGAAFMFGNTFQHKHIHGQIDRASNKYT